MFRCLFIVFIIVKMIVVVLYVIFNSLEYNSACQMNIFGQNLWCAKCFKRLSSSLAHMKNDYNKFLLFPCSTYSNV